MIRGFLGATWRLFGWQASWNHERLQGLGMAVTIAPLLRDLPGGPDGTRHRVAIGRAAQYFNTNPYLAGLAVGAVARAECDDLDGEQTERLRSALKGPLGAVGDRLIWTGVLPVASAVGLVVGVLVHPLAGAAALLGVFNVVTLPVRFWSIPAGWRLGRLVGQALVHPVVRRVDAVFDAGSKLAAGIAVPLVLERLVTRLVPGQWMAVVVIGIIAAVMLKWLAPTLGGTRMALTILALVAMTEWIWR